MGIRRDEHPEMLPAAAAHEGPGRSTAAAGRFLARNPHMLLAAAAVDNLGMSTAAAD
jgi:hypothetical protein